MMLPRVLAALAVGLAAFAGATGAGAQEPGDLRIEAAAVGAFAPHAARPSIRR